MIRSDKNRTVVAGDYVTQEREDWQDALSLRKTAFYEEKEDEKGLILALHSPAHSQGAGTRNFFNAEFLKQLNNGLQFGMISRCL